MKTAIIGAGMAGLACARALQDRKIDVTLFDKSRGFGGRVATKRRGALRFDHGLPVFEPDAAEWISDLTALPRWDDFGHVAEPGMNSFPRALAAPLRTVLETTITAITQDAGRYHLDSAEGVRHGPFTHLVIAIPAPQAAQLVDDPAIRHALGDITYAPCRTLMLALDCAPPRWARLSPSGGIIAKIIRETSKPGRDTAPERFTIHAAADWSARMLEEPAEAVEPALLSAFADATGIDCHAPVHCSSHRWRYAQPVSVHPASCAADAAGQIVVCGDGFGADRTGGDAAAAWRSGLAAAGIIARSA